MNLKSLLFVPGDSEKKLAKAASTGADALLLDLEDAVSPARLPMARGLVLAYLKQHDRQRQQVWVRINPLNQPMALADLVAVMPGKPDGIVLPKPLNAHDVQQLDHYLQALEVREGFALHSTRILPVATEVELLLGDATKAANGLKWKPKVLFEVGEAVRHLLERTVERYGHDTDFTSMARILEADAGLDLPSPPATRP